MLSPFTTTAPTGFSLGRSSSSKRGPGSDTWKAVKTVVPEKERVTLPLFNIVDDGDSTQGSLAKAVAEVWGVEWGFLNSAMAALVQQFAKVAKHIPSRR